MKEQLALWARPARALREGSVTKLRALADEAGSKEPRLSAWMLERLDRYDLQAFSGWLENDQGRS